MYINLTHELNKKTPTYGNRNIFLIQEVKKSDSKQKSAGCKIQFHNHTGTHIDFPSHFIKNGKNLSSYKKNFFLFKKILLTKINIPEKSYLIDNNDFKKIKIKIKNKNIDFILIKTNYGKLRTKNRNKFIFDGPGIKSEVALYLKKKFPNLKCIGFDFISLSSFRHSVEGKKSHIEFLKRNILIIEDMNLEKVKKNMSIKELLCIPLPVKEIDGSPCNIIARI
jgi:kynurenine formamidase